MGGGLGGAGRVWWLWEWVGWGDDQERLFTKEKNDDRLYSAITQATASVKRIFFGFSTIYGVALSLLFAWGLWFQDMPALEKAVKSNAQHAEMRHRINVFADGVWFLLANIIVLNSVAAMSQASKKND